MKFNSVTAVTSGEWLAVDLRLGQGEQGSSQREESRAAEISRRSALQTDGQVPVTELTAAGIISAQTEQAVVVTVIGF